jgi:hypothetical protein
MTVSWYWAQDAPLHSFSIDRAAARQSDYDKASAESDGN